MKKSPWENQGPDTNASWSSNMKWGNLLDSNLSKMVHNTCLVVSIPITQSISQEIKELTSEIWKSYLVLLYILNRVLFKGWLWPDGSPAPISWKLRLLLYSVLLRYYYFKTGLFKTEKLDARQLDIIWGKCLEIVSWRKKKPWQAWGNLIRNQQKFKWEKTQNPPTGCLLSWFDDKASSFIPASLLS